MFTETDIEHDAHLARAVILCRGDFTTMVCAPADPIGLWLSRWRGMYGWRRAPLGRGSSMEAGAAGEVLLQGAPGLEQLPEGTGARWHLLPLGQHLHRAAPGQGGPSSESGGVLPQVVL